jgi:hypothetical protein
VIAAPPAFGESTGKGLETYRSSGDVYVLARVVHDREAAVFVTAGG